MKDKIILFIIGVLLGAVISTGAFYAYTTTNNNNSCQTMQMPGGNPPEMPSGSNNQSGGPPAMPNQNNSQTASN